ncbi:MAG: YggS family pyridoxal phosphate-dependent enzyme [Paludisphaera borealis]|uniref:YggS family pyridoxal phosphate-dependent enzyme n=1 Tax=Paludisphaera borealis TaxID=1387353 RepID=UPI00284A03E4|nr:YggS family pyridoxal phosphate-dependent enzyme [Paludisphaera borealis]MDR3621695.1 YggS family pyridoxal phosphate-dependent enzyme [Paludisphaera borealis]
MNSDRIRDNLLSVHDRIAVAARRVGRRPESVSLVAVTKKWPVELIRPLIEAGARDLGENYPQELWRKVEALADAPGPLRWHLIGHLQGNKARRTLPLVRAIHAVDSLKLLRTLDELAAEFSDPPVVCLQVNTSGEEAKHGWSDDAILADAEAIAACQRIRVVGLMTMAAWGTDAESARPSFVRLRVVRDALAIRSGLALPELSMGMSNDFETAVEEGATLVRVGSALLEGVDA